eukprot:scaffold5052_cov131-Isochrysis_galbana.AAC.6
MPLAAARVLRAAPCRLWAGEHGMDGGPWKETEREAATRCGRSPPPCISVPPSGTSCAQLSSECAVCGRPIAASPGSHPPGAPCAETWSAADGAGVGRRHRPGLLGRPRTPLPHPPALVPQKQEHAEGDKDTKSGRGADDGEHHYRSRGSTVPSTTAGGTSDDAEIERLGGPIVHTHTALRGGEGLMQPVELGGAHRPARLEESPVHALGARGSRQRARPEIIPG